jgi:eukaryotic-like serine/threonine-protein kinase
MLAPETVLQSRYRIIRQLGQGGMGAVYEALDERLDATVALKETLFTDERLRKQFEREARLLARMHHPALPRVSDHFAEGDGEFLVMQFIQGDDLCQMMIRKQGPFPANQVLTWGDQLLDALDYLHTQDPQIIHRDIKPQNLKLTSRGQIILLDFGLAKGQGGGVSLVTTSASIYGYTPNYAPLEQIQGLGTDARSDIYALSATLYHLMTNVKPPDALTRAAALVNGQPDPLVPANEIISGIGPEVANVLARGMSQNRDQRFPTAVAMSAALNGTGEAATLIGRTEAATVLAKPSAAKLADATQASPKQTAIGSDTTVVRPPAAQGKMRLAPSGISIGVGITAFVLIGLLFGGFYAYQRKNDSTIVTPTNTPLEQVNSVTATPDSTTAHETEPSAGAVTEERKAEVGNQRIIINDTSKKANQAARKVEKALESGNIGATPIPNTPRVADRYNPPLNLPANPASPQINEPDLSRPRGRRGQAGDTSIRNFPDGRQVITNPDGSRVVIFPNGASRVFRRGERIQPRKN